MIKIKSIIGTFFAESMENIGSSKTRFNKVSQYGPGKNSFDQLILSNHIIIMMEMKDEQL